MKTQAIYPGTFDPLTLGHQDLVERAAAIFKHVTVAVVEHSRKQTVFPIDARVTMAREALRKFRNVTVESFDGLLVEYARAKGVAVVVRGIRAYTDFEYEFQMALTNRKLAPDVETLFMLPQEAYSYITSSTVREVMERGGDISGFVPAAVSRHVRRWQRERSSRR